MNNTQTLSLSNFIKSPIKIRFAYEVQLAGPMAFTLKPQLPNKLIA